MTVEGVSIVSKEIQFVQSAEQKTDRCKSVKLISLNPIKKSFVLTKLGRWEEGGFFCRRKEGRVKEEGRE